MAAQNAAEDVCSPTCRNLPIMVREVWWVLHDLNLKIGSPPPFPKHNDVVLAFEFNHAILKRNKVYRLTGATVPHIRHTGEKVLNSPMTKVEKTLALGECDNCGKGIKLDCTDLKVFACGTSTQEEVDEALKKWDMAN